MTPTAAMHVVFAGGATAGHLFPGLTVADQLRRETPGVRITLAGSGRPFERAHVAAAGLDYLPLRCRAAPRRLWQWPGFLLDNLAGYCQARQFLHTQRAAAVVGLGGFASVPMARAAVSLGIPLVLLEQNALAGRATRWLARHAAAVCLAFDESRKCLASGCNVRVTGNSVRPEFFEQSASRRKSGPNACVGSLNACVGIAGFLAGSVGTLVSTPDARATDARLPDAIRPGAAMLAPRQLLVLGGSGGARTLNEQVPQSLRCLGADLEGWTVLHQSGESAVEAARRAYREAGVAARVVPFIADMPSALAASDLAISRAGGTTLAELAAAGVPALLVPYPHAADDHQRRNAEVFVVAGGCALLDERQCGARLAERMADTLRLLVLDGDLRASMVRSIRRLARPNAARDVAAVIRRVAAAE